ncbi:MAG: V-type ATP synthase subunit E family protein [Candidatus Omnitrophica bacterium]|nr:V-type ATP synthase subunit E family protein [Candidatus Omnitrophota bacterium]
MAEEIKELIEKIRSEGVRAGEDKARAIEFEAQKKARQIINDAEAEAKRILSDARESIRRSEESSRSSLKQAARDVVIGLKKEILAMLNKITLSRMHKALTIEETGKLIAHLLKECKAKDKGDVVVSLKKEDADKLAGVLMSELSGELKKNLVLKPSEDIRGGFTISYDHGKSYYDFTDRALADYIGSYIRPKLIDILKEI